MGVGAMHKHCVEESNIERFLDKYVPGGDPTATDFDAFYHPAQMEGMHEVQVNAEIVSTRNQFSEGENVC